MSELLMKGLASTKRELEAGVADAEAELAKTEEYCRKLEELVAVGKATLHAASQTNFQASSPVREIGSQPGAPSNADDVAKRLARQAQS
jgi:hypothetical protein